VIISFDDSEYVCSFREKLFPKEQQIWFSVKMKEKNLYCLLNNVRTFPMLNVMGLDVPFFFDAEKVRQAITLEARENDIYIVSKNV